MKAKASILIAFLLVLNLFSCGTAEESASGEKPAADVVQPGFSRYDHKSFALHYPTAWDTVNKDKRMIFMAVEERKGEKDIFRENFTVYTIALDKPMTLEALAESAAASYVQAGKDEKNIVEKSVKKNGKGFTYGLFRIKEIAQERSIDLSIVYFMKGQEVIVLTCSHDASAGDGDYPKTWDVVVNSFEVK